MNETKTRSTVKTIAKINNVNIVVVENGEKRVAVRPICDALGIAYQGQIDKVKQDEILGSTLMPSMMVGKDGKEREMQTIPYKFVFGWLFSINPKNVSEEARPLVLKYKLKCYDALYYHFTAHSEFLELKQVRLEEILTQHELIKKNFNAAKNDLKKSTVELNKIREWRFEDWDAENRQMKMNFN